MGLSGPVPARVPAEVKELVLATVDEAVVAGFPRCWPQARTCSCWCCNARRGPFLDQACSAVPLCSVGHGPQPWSADPGATTTAASPAVVI